MTVFPRGGGIVIIVITVTLLIFLLVLRAQEGELSALRSPGLPVFDALLLLEPAGEGVELPGQALAR